MMDTKLTHNPIGADPDTSTGHDTQPPGAPTDRQAAARGTAHTLRLQRLVNRVVRGLLRAPLLCRAVGNWLVTVYVTGPHIRAALRGPGGLHAARRQPAHRHRVRLGQ